MRERCCRHCLPAYHHDRPSGPDGASCTSVWRRGLAVVRGLRSAARTGLRRGLVRVRIEVRVVVGRGLLLVAAAVAALGVVAGGGLRARRDALRVRVDALAVGVLLVLAALARVVAEERLTRERLGGL